MYSNRRRIRARLFTPVLLILSAVVLLAAIGACAGGGLSGQAVGVLEEEKEKVDTLLAVEVANKKAAEATVKQLQDDKYNLDTLLSEYKTSRAVEVANKTAANATMKQLRDEKKQINTDLRTKLNDNNKLIKDNRALLREALNAERSNSQVTRKLDNVERNLSNIDKKLKQVEEREKKLLAARDKLLGDKANLEKRLTTATGVDTDKLRNEINSLRADRKALRDKANIDKAEINKGIRAARDAKTASNKAIGQLRNDYRQAKAVAKTEQKRLKAEAREQQKRRKAEAIAEQKAMSKVTASAAMAFVSWRTGNADIFVRTEDGDLTNITNHTAHESGPVWSHDGKRIAFQSNRDNNFEIYVTDPDGSNVTRLTTSTTEALKSENSDDRHPDWSPDGTKILFYSDRDGDGEIYVMSAGDSDGDGNGDNLIQLTNNADEDRRADWSHDGTKIVFSSSRDAGKKAHEIYVMDADGSNVTRLTNNLNGDRQPAWSPDGTKIAFRSDRDGNWEVYVMDANGTHQKRLTVNDGVDRHAEWSPDGTKIAFRSNRYGNASDIYVMEAVDEDNDGRGDNLARLTNNKAKEYSPAWKPEDRVAVVAGPLPVERPFTATLYHNIKFNGRATLFNQDDSCLEKWDPPWKTPPGKGGPHVGRNTASSLELSPGTRVTLYEECDFKGKSVTYLADDDDLRDDTWEGDAKSPNDRVASIRITGRYQAVAVQGGINWDAAHKAAEEAGGHLATITSEDENDLIVDMFPEVVKGGYWLGGLRPGDTRPAGKAGSEAAKEGWEWITGEPFVYANWGVGEPNNAGGGPNQQTMRNRENRASFWYKGHVPQQVSHWGDVPNTSKHGGYVIEYELPGTVFKPAAPVVEEDPEELAKRCKGPRLFFVSQRDGNKEIYRMKSDGRNQKNLSNNPANDSSPNQSCDGEKVVFHSDRDGNYEIYSMNDDGTDVQRLTNTAEYVAADSSKRFGQGWDGNPVWSPDREKIAFASKRDGHYEIYVMNADGTDYKRLTDGENFNKNQPAWSPDGTKIVFQGQSREEPYQSEIYVMDAADGKNVQRLTDDAKFTHKQATSNEGNPAYSPDGTKIAFWTTRNGPVVEQWVMNPDGTEQKPLIFIIDVGPLRGKAATWRPNGKEIILSVHQNSNWDVWKMDADGKNPKRLTTDGAKDHTYDH